MKVKELREKLMKEKEKIDRESEKISIKLELLDLLASNGEKPKRKASVRYRAGITKVVEEILRKDGGALSAQEILKRTRLVLKDPNMTMRALQSPFYSHGNCNIARVSPGVYRYQEKIVFRKAP